MKIFIIYILLIVPFFLVAKSNFDLTGRVSVQVLQTVYDEKSKIKPDTISNDQYSKTSLIPGIQQTMNLSLFGRAKNLDITLLSDIKNNQWDKFKFNEISSIDRFSLNVKLYNHEFIFGDFYQSNNDRYIQSSEIRGIKYNTEINEMFGQNSFINISGMIGSTQKAVKIGQKLEGVYRQYESTGQYQRQIALANIKAGNLNLFDISIRFLEGEDNKSSIEESFNNPLKNRLVGFDTNFFIWGKKIKFFADYYSSQKDSIDAGSANDYSMRGGFDFVINNIKLMIMYLRIGSQYYTMGYPFLENDKQGFKAEAAYKISNAVSIYSDFEKFKNNLDNDPFRPVTKTNILNSGLITRFKNYPEFSFNYGLRTDLGNAVLNNDSLKIDSDKLTAKYEFKLAYNINRTRLSLSAIKIKLDDKSLLGAINSTDSTLVNPLGTDQFITSFNFYSQLSQYLFFSGGFVFSSLSLTNDQKSDNFYFYESNRWDVIPRKLKIESTVTAIFNDSKNGGIQDLLSDYFQVNAQISLEYFFNDFVSLKIITGNDSKSFKYKSEEAKLVITDPDYGPTFFNGNESYSGWVFGGEFNLNF